MNHSMKVVIIVTFMSTIVVSFVKCEESCNPTGSHNDIFITPCVSSITVKIGQLPTYQIAICHTYNLTRPVAWFHGDELVTTDTSEPLYQIYDIQGKDVYPASLAVGNWGNLTIMRLRCDEIRNGALDDTLEGIDVTVKAYVEGSAPNVTVTPTYENSTEVFCFSVKKQEVSWYFGDIEVTSDKTKNVYQKPYVYDAYHGSLLTYKKASESESGCYTCISKDISEESECVDVRAYVSAQLEISPDERYFEFERSTGFDLEISCILSDTRPYNISWYKDKDEITFNTLSVIHQVAESRVKTKLVIDSDAGFSDSGSYKCVAVWDVFEDFIEIDLEVKGDFTVNLSPDTDEVTFIIGGYPDVINILCYSSVDILITWYHNSDKVTDDPGELVFQDYTNINESTLHLSNNNDLTNAGTYTCKRNGSDGGLFQSLNVYFYEQGNIEIEMDGHSDRSKSYFTASAYQANVEVSLNWYRNGILVLEDTNSEAFQVKSIVEDTVYATLIIINNPEATDAFGEYFCIAVDSTNNLATSSSIVYQGYTSLTLSTTGESIHMTSGGEGIEIDCSASDDKYSLSWFAEGKLVSKDTSDAVYQVADDTISKVSLYVQSFAAVDRSGTYTCSALNADATESKSIYVHIEQERPTASTSTPSTTTSSASKPSTSTLSTSLKALALSVIFFITNM